MEDANDSLANYLSSQLGSRSPPGYPGLRWGLRWTPQPCSLRGSGFHWKVSMVEGELYFPRCFDVEVSPVSIIYKRAIAE